MNLVNTASDITPDSYTELFTRNSPMVSFQTQDRLSKIKVLVAGCGSTGGAFIEGASRLGVRNFCLVEPGSFELNNLNRQFVYPEDIGHNKAEVHQNRLSRLFQGSPYQVQINKDGIQRKNVKDLIQDSDFIFDAIDVTTADGIRAKFLLHEESARQKKVVLSALDLGFKQWIRYYDYRHEPNPLEGKLEKARQIQHPLKALIFGICPLEELSYEIAFELKRLLTVPNSNACQLGTACHLLAAFAAPYLIRHVEGKVLPKTCSVDLMRTLETPIERATHEAKLLALQKELKALLDAID